MQIKEEDENLRYLKKYRFEKTLAKLVKQLKDKKVIIYGDGSIFQLIKKHYDLSGLNIIGIADKRYETSSETVNENGYKIYRLNEIEDSEADYILVTIKFYVRILEDLYEQFKYTRIKIKPLVKKPFLTLLKEL